MTKLTGRFLVEQGLPSERAHHRIRRKVCRPLQIEPVVISLPRSSSSERQEILGDRPHRMPTSPSWRALKAEAKSCWMEDGAPTLALLQNALAMGTGPSFLRPSESGSGDYGGSDSHAGGDSYASCTSFGQLGEGKADDNLATSTQVMTAPSCAPMLACGTGHGDALASDGPPFAMASPSQQRDAILDRASTIIACKLAAEAGAREELGRPALPCCRDEAGRPPLPCVWARKHRWPALLDGPQVDAACGHNESPAGTDNSHRFLEDQNIRRQCVEGLSPRRRLPWQIGRAVARFSSSRKGSAMHGDDLRAASVASSRSAVSPGPLPPSTVVELALDLNKNERLPLARTSSRLSNHSKGLCGRTPSPVATPRATDGRKSPPELATRVKKNIITPVRSPQPQIARQDATNNLEWLLAVEGMLSRCAKCSHRFDHNDRLCRVCGDIRLEKKFVGEAFFGYSAGRVLRKTDLKKLAEHVAYLHHRGGALSEETVTGVLEDVERAFDKVIEMQLLEGNPWYNQGLTLDYFPFILTKIAAPRNVSMADLVSFLIEELQGRKHRGVHEDDGIAAGESPKAQLTAHRTLVEMCPKCGSSKTRGEQFCQKCGHKHDSGSNSPNADNRANCIGFMSTLFKNTAKHHGPSGDDHCQVIVLAKQYNMSVVDVWRKRQEFHDIDTNKNGLLSHTEFMEVIRKRCNVPAEEPIPDHLSSVLSQAVHNIPCSENQSIDFEAFFHWSCRTEYSENVLVSCPGERTLRRLARENGLPLPDVERIKVVFDGFDTDKSGAMTEEEFTIVLMKLLGAKKTTDVSKELVRRYWKEVDSDLSGSVSFEEFLLWYFNNMYADEK